MANNNDYAFTKLFLFFTSKDFNPRMSFDVFNISDTTTCKQMIKKKAIDIFEAMQTIWKYKKKSLTKAQISHLNPVNKYKKEVFYDIRDKMWLSTRNINTDQTSKKLLYNMIGLFEVIEKKDISLELQLPQTIKIYNVFNLNLL